MFADDIEEVIEIEEMELDIAWWKQRMLESDYSIIG